MKTKVLLIGFYMCCVHQSSQLKAQNGITKKSGESFIYSKEQLEKLMTKPPCMGEYLSSQSGPLRKPDGNGNFTTDSTFTVEKIKVPSEGLKINGWLYLPIGNQKCPLIVLTNGGGDNVRSIKSFSDFMAPVLAHCGFAAFVHDKRGTGESEGDYVRTTYNDYITDAGNCAIFLSRHKRIDPDLIGVMGASEGGRIAVITASRFPVITFAISQAGTVVSTVEDRLYAQLNGMKDGGTINDSISKLVRPFWEKSFLAWASNDPGKHEKVDKEIIEARKIYARDALPATKHEMESIPDFKRILPTWRSMPNDYLTELGHFKKKWLAIFGEIDRVVPTEASIKNINHYMAISENEDYNIAVIPKMGHVPVDVETKRMIDFHYLIINWLNENVKGN
jgi:pimeloyl-ACP methyl ester carboxylesterase